MSNNDYYKLVGVFNPFGIYPDFIYPIFRKNNKYYIQEYEDDIIDHFKEITRKECISMIRFLDDDNTVNNIKRQYSIGDRPIIAFQISRNDFFISDITNFIPFISSFETDDHILIDEISIFFDKVNPQKKVIKIKEKTK